MNERKLRLKFSNKKIKNILFSEEFKNLFGQQFQQVKTLKKIFFLKKSNNWTTRKKHQLRLYDDLISQPYQMKAIKIHISFSDTSTPNPKEQHLISALETFSAVNLFVLFAFVSNVMCLKLTEIGARTIPERIHFDKCW